MKNFLRIITVAALLLGCSITAQAAQNDPLTGNAAFKDQNFVNAWTNGAVGSLNATNVIYQFTNGSTTVTSAPVALRGSGFALELLISPTNALLTNIVNEFRFSRDGTNWASTPTLLWRTATGAIAAGSYCELTNVLQDAYKNFRYIQHWKVHLTNGVNTVGSAFSTNRSPVRITQLME